MRRILNWLPFCLFLAFVTTLICLADLGKGQRFYGWVAHIPAGDKLAHVFLFGTLALLANAAMDIATFQWGRISVLKGSLLVFIPTVLEEFSQLHFRSRSFDVLDLLADVIGVTLGGLIAVLLVRYFNLWTTRISPVRTKSGLELAPSRPVD